MEPANWDEVKELFDIVLQLPEERRATLLDALTPELRSEVESLIAAHRTDGFLQRAPRPPEPSSLDDVDEHLDVQLAKDTDYPERIGTYRLGQRIGQGGMGVVFAAEQQSPVRRRVALKLVKWGMDTKQVIARFESERQALAVMNHPNIASVLDAGATDEGRPYFAMEYVQGIPITDYCDKHRLSIEERLGLFVEVCDGVQHAHQKGIIHRDIKPSNVLVAVQDQKPVPKIIDFGVSKATSQRLTEHTVATELGQLIGTPEYMSPEQAEMTNLDIDTRTDVYSLGVLLYELLVGAQPFDPKELRDAGLAEIQRRLREEEPPRPSARVVTLGERAPTAAANRRFDARALQRRLRGDLDWIVMKALEKDRTRRYETANALALDIGRYLQNETVRARAPSHLYRAQKFVRRHRGAVAAAIVIVGLLIGAVASTLIQSSRIRRERDRAEREAATAVATREFLQETLGSADPTRGVGREVTVVESLDRAVQNLDRFERSPEIDAAIRGTIGKTYLSLGRVREAETLLREALETRERAMGPDHIDVAESLADLGALVNEQGQYDEAQEVFVRALAIERDSPDVDAGRLSRTLSGLGNVYHARGDFDEARRVFEEIREILQGVPDETDELAMATANLGKAMAATGETDAAEELFRDALRRLNATHDGNPRLVATVLGELGVMLHLAGRSEESRDVFLEQLEVERRLLGEDHPDVAVTLANLGVVVDFLGDTEDAVERYEEALAIQTKQFGRKHPGAAQTLMSLGKTFERRGDIQRALAMYRESLDVKRELLDENHPDLGMSVGNTANLLCTDELRETHLAEALELHEETIRIFTAGFDENHWMIAQARSYYGACLTRIRRFEAAEANLLAADAAFRSTLGDESPRTQATIQNLVTLYDSWGKPERARELEKRLPAQEARSK